LSSGLSVADDVSLFVLDDQGVFFSETRQELYTFNTPATFVWCCLEEGLEPSGIASAYASAFGVHPDEAGRHVAAVLHQWQGLGYLSGFEGSGAPEIELTTALGRLLTNRSLRVDFARSPTETARALRIRPADLEALLALDPGELELQAELVSERHAALRLGAAAPGSEAVFASVFAGHRSVLDVAAESRLRQLSTPPRTRSYRLLTTTFALRFVSAAQVERVHPALAHLEIAPPAQVDVVLDVVEGDGGHLLLDDLLPAGHCARLDQLAPLVKARMRQMAVDRHPHFLQLHAGVVSDGERCLVLPGAPGCGKTTLTAALSLAGFQYFSDEFALLEEGTLEVRPVPLALTIKPGAVDVLAQHYPHVRDLPTHLREDAQIVRYLTPPAAALEPERSRPVRWLVFPRYSPGAETALRPVGRAEALHRLMSECLALPNLLDRPGVEGLVKWIRGVDCFELPSSSLGDAVDLLKTLHA
jgi:hypothetical protein